MVAEKPSTALSISHKKLNEGVIEMERNMHRLEQYVANASKFQES